MACKGGGGEAEGQPPLLPVIREKWAHLSIIGGGGISHLPAPYTSNQTPFGGFEKQNKTKQTKTTQKQKLNKTKTKNNNNNKKSLAPLSMCCACHWLNVNDIWICFANYLP